jgi:hypothetical protein
MTGEGRDVERGRARLSGRVAEGAATAAGRGAGPALSTKDAVVKAKAYFDAHREFVEKLLAASPGDPELVAAGRDHLAHPAVPEPLGAAVIGAALAVDGGWPGAKELADMVDVWVVTHGVTFAARCLVEMRGVEIYDTGDYHARTHHLRRLAPTVTTPGYQPQWRIMAARVRSHLAAASDEEYAATVAALTPYRERTLLARVATSFLLPTETAWMDADSKLVTSFREDQTELLWCSASTVAQASEIVEHMHAWGVSLEQFATALDGVGPAVAPLFIRWYDAEYGRRRRPPADPVDAGPGPDRRGLRAADRPPGPQVRPARRARRRQAVPAAGAAAAGGGGHRPHRRRQGRPGPAAGARAGPPELVEELVPTLSPDAAAAVAARDPEPGRAGGGRRCPAGPARDSTVDGEAAEGGQACGGRACPAPTSPRSTGATASRRPGPRPRSPYMNRAISRTRTGSMRGRRGSDASHAHETAASSLGARGAGATPDRRGSPARSGSPRSG